MRLEGRLAIGSNPVVAADRRLVVISHGTGIPDAVDNEDASELDSIERRVLHATDAKRSRRKT